MPRPYQKHRYIVFGRGKAGQFQFDYAGPKRLQNARMTYVTQAAYARYHGHWDYVCLYRDDDMIEQYVPDTWEE